MKTNVVSRRKFPLIMGGAILIASLSLTYQNCAGPSSTVGGEDVASTDLSEQPLYKQAPLAFEASVNQISYMSCTKFLYTSSNDARKVGDKKAFYTFRLGAYGNTAGVKLSDDFIEYANSNFGSESSTDTNANTPASDADLKKLIANSSSKDAQLQISIRGRNNPVGVLVSSGTTAKVGDDLAQLVAPLGHGKIVEQLLQYGKSTSVNYFYGDIGTANRSVEGSLYFNQLDESLAEDLRNGLLNDDMLMLAFVKAKDKSGSAFQPLSPRGSSGEEISDRIQGRGYKLGFTSANSQNNDLANRIMESVMEVDASSSSYQSMGNWECSAANRYMIVDLEDAFGDPNVDTDGVCPLQTYASRSQAAHVAAREIAERHLPADKWHINTERKCVVPKAATNSCYGQIQVEYDTTKACDRTGTPKDCAHYVSICTKQ